MPLMATDDTTFCLGRDTGAKVVYLAEAVEMQAAAGGPRSRLRRYGKTAFAWMQERTWLA